MENDDSGSGYAGAANKLIKLFADTASVWTEPARIRRVANARAEESRILTEAEIERERSLGDARHRMEILELRRQKNLEEIAKRVAEMRGIDFSIEDPDFLVDFVESCKDTSDPTIQEIWAKLLAGEMDTKGSCSKRTLRMVRTMSREEALLVRGVCRRICVVEEYDGSHVAFLPVAVNWLEHKIAEPGPTSHTLYADETPDRRQRDRRLLACGFLSNEDYKFRFTGDGRMTADQYHLSEFSAKRIVMRPWSIVADHKQSGLLFPPARSQAGGVGLGSPSSSIEVDAWRLTNEGEELYRALNEEPDSRVWEELKEALRYGGLSFSETPSSSRST